MRIALSAETRNGLDGVVSPHFGRCPHYIPGGCGGPRGKGVHEVDSPFYSHHQPGQVPAFIDSLGAPVMLAGGMGGWAITLFRQHAPESVTGAYSTVRQSVERYLGGQLKGAAPCKESQEHAHSASVAERSAVVTDLPAEGEYEKDELGRLREEAEMIRQQLEEVTSQLGRLS